MKYLVLLWVEIFELYSGRKSSSSLAMEVGDGARYWMPFGAVKQKAPVVAGAWRGRINTVCRHCTAAYMQHLLLVAG